MAAHTFVPGQPQPGAYTTQPPPPLGHAMLEYFAFDPGYVNLNNGSFGAPPVPVQDECAALARRIEARPDLFLRLEYQPLLLSARTRVAELIGAHTDEVVLVANASSGVNTVLRNLEWRAGDILVGASTTYASVHKSLQYIHDINPGTVLAPFALRFPTTHAEIVAAYRAHLRALPRRPGSKVVAVIDGIVSVPGVQLPWRALVQVCREEKVWSIVDAAHSIGQEVGINLGEANPDFWVSNCHKWLYAKRGCAVLYVPKRHQHLIKSSFPTSHSYQTPGAVPDYDWLAQFEWNGTVDYVPFLSVNAALDFRAWLGGEKVINDYCHALALKGGVRLAEILGTRVMDPSGELTANMVNVELPLPKLPACELAGAGKMFLEGLLLEWNAFAAVYMHDGLWWVRCSAQVWNEVADFEYVGKALLAICKEIVEKAPGAKAAFAKEAEQLKA